MSELDELLRSLGGESDWRRHRALERLREEGASPATVAALTDELGADDATRRAVGRMALSALAHPESPAHAGTQRRLRALLRADDPDLRILAASALGEAGDPSAAEDLVRALEDDSPNVVAAAAEALGQLGSARALPPLTRLLEAEDFWLRAAAVVALGQLKDSRAVPALSSLAGTAGLEKLVVEALRRIGHPDALDGLARLRETAFDEALRAAGSILCSHPEVEAPAWVREGARRVEEALRYELVEDDEPPVARLLGLTGTTEALGTLLDLACEPRRSEAAISGLLVTPPAPRIAAILERLPEADREDRVTLLSVLPPVTEPEAIHELLPLLAEQDETVRAAAAEALARAPADQALPLLASELDREGVAPEVIRALGGLGGAACQSLLPLLRDSSADVRVAAAEALARCADEAIVEDVLDALERERDPGVRLALLRALGAAGGERAVRRLSDALDAPSLRTRLAAIEGLGLTGSPEAVPALRRSLGASDPETRAAIRALGDLRDPAAASLLRRYLEADDPDLRRSAARAAIHLATALDAETVRRLAADSDPWVRVLATRIMARRGAGDAAILQDLADADPDPTVREEARRAARERH